MVVERLGLEVMSGAEQVPCVATPVQDVLATSGRHLSPLCLETFPWSIAAADMVGQRISSEACLPE